jgi:hypothetical protein
MTTAGGRCRTPAFSQPAPAIRLRKAEARPKDLRT